MMKASQSLAKMKQGPKSNRKWVELGNSVWYDACEIYITKYSQMTFSAFLQAKESGPHFTGNKSQCVFLLAEN